MDRIETLSVYGKITLEWELNPQPGTYRANFLHKNTKEKNGSSLNGI